MEANDLFASVGDVGGTGYTLSRASLSAFGLGDYPEALRLGRAGYEAFSEVNHRWGLIVALCRIRFAALALGDVAEAHVRLAEALERARASQAISLELLALSGIGACLAEDPVEQERAAVILTFAMSHDQFPPSYAIAARPALDRLEAKLPPARLAAAREAAAADAGRARADGMSVRLIRVRASACGSPASFRCRDSSAVREVIDGTPLVSWRVRT